MTLLGKIEKLKKSMTSDLPVALSSRTRNALLAAGVRTMDELLNLDGSVRIGNIGVRGWEEIVEVIISSENADIISEGKIDVHTHYLPPAYYAMLDRRNITLLDGGMPRPDWSVEQHLKNMEELGIVKAYLSVSSPHLHFGDKNEAAETARGCNEYGAELVKMYPEKLGIMASLPLPEVEESIQEISYCRDDLGINSFALMTNSCGVYLGDLSLDPVMEELDRIHAVVSLHPTEPGAVPGNVCTQLPYPLMEFFFDTSRTVVNMILNKTFRRYPGIRFIIPHAGAVLPILHDRLKGLSALMPQFKDVDFPGDLKNLYYDLAGMVLPAQMYGLEQMGIEKSHLLYGSDGTFTPLPLCKKLAADLEKLPYAEQIFIENPGRLFERN